jgi:hypothetical protein
VLIGVSLTNNRPQERIQPHETYSDGRRVLRRSRLFGAWLGTADQPRREPNGHARPQSRRAGIDAVHHRAGSGSSAVHAATRANVPVVNTAIFDVSTAAELPEPTSRAYLSQEEDDVFRQRQ